MGTNVRKRDWGGLVGGIPAVVIGEIMSRVGVARYVIRASLTCRKWREAFCKHLHTLYFGVGDDYGFYRTLPTFEVEMLITKTIFQTSGLRKLWIMMHHRHEFSAGSVVSWLMYTRETLLDLCFEFRTSPTINVLELCGRQKLKSLGLVNYRINDFDPNFPVFPYVTLLFLRDPHVSVENLSRLLLSFPKLEHLDLASPQWEEKTGKLCFPTLKALHLRDILIAELILEICDIVYLDVKRCVFRSFKIAGSKRLRHFTFSISEAYILEIEDANNLECVEFISCNVTHSNLFPMEIHAPKLKTFRIWGLNKKFISSDIDDYYIMHDWPHRLVDFDQMALCLPQLSHLSVLYEPEEHCVYKFGGMSLLENVVFLEIGWDFFTRFWEWAENVLEYCPNVRNLVFHGMIPENTDPKFLKEFAEHNSSMVEMMKDPKYENIDVECVYTHPSKFREKMGI